MVKNLILILKLIHPIDFKIDLFQRFLLEDKILLKRDRLTSKREEEYEFLRSNDFQQILKSADINLTRFFDT